MSEKKVFLKAEGRNIVYNVYKYFYANMTDKSIESIVEKSSSATGVSKGTVRRIIKEKPMTKTLGSPKKRRRTKPVTEIDDSNALLDE